MAGGRLAEKFLHRSQFCYARQESNSKPPQAICKPLTKQNE
jgi:hypothetical protein